MTNTDSFTPNPNPEDDPFALANQPIDGAVHQSAADAFAALDDELITYLSEGVHQVVLKNLAKSDSRDALGWYFLCQLVDVHTGESSEDWRNPVAMKEIIKLHLGEAQVWNGIARPACWRISGILNAIAEQDGVAFPATANTLLKRLQYLARGNQSFRVWIARNASGYIQAYFTEYAWMRAMSKAGRAEDYGHGQLALTDSKLAAAYESQLAVINGTGNPASSESFDEEAPF